MTPDKKTLTKLLERDDFVNMENEIAGLASTFVNRGMLAKTIGFLVRDVENSGLELDLIMETIRSDGNKLIQFGVELLCDKEREKTQYDEEYPPGEELDEDEKPVVLRNEGLGPGFGIKYAIYYYFLSNQRIDSLTNYLNALRIPFHKRFSLQLQNIFDRIK